MRFVHLADLHIGKKVNEISMIEDQRFVLKQVLKVIEEYEIDGVILAGDIYDRQVPSAEAVQLLDWFLTELSKMKMPVYMISGNHDSGERLAFGAQLLKRSGVFVASVYDGTLEPIVLKDAYGELYLYLLPFVKPVHVKRVLKRESGEMDVLQESEGKEKGSLKEDDQSSIFVEAGEKQDIEENVIEHTEEIQTYHEAIRAVLENASVNPQSRNLLVMHQLVTGAARCESEDISVGGIDNVDASLFESFDYVALGHIHGPQSMTKDTIRYAGTLLKYSFSECNHKKSITIVELKEKGQVSVETIPVKPLHDMRQIKGTYETLMSYDFYKEDNKEDYLRVILTDEEEIPDVMGRMRTVYPNIMKLEYENTRTKTIRQMEETQVTENKSPLNYFEEFYARQNNQEMTEEQRRLAQELIDKIWG